MRALHPLPPLVLLAACHQEPDPVDLFATDPATAMQQVAATSDPVVQEALVLRLAETYPGKTGDLCRLVMGPGGPTPAAERCLRLNQRAHLWTVDPAETRRPPPIRPGGGPSTFRPPGVPIPRDPPPPADPGPCDPGRGDFGACIVREATTAAVAGDLARVGARCEALGDDANPRWRQDCYFTAAEHVLRDDGQYRAGLVLCGRTGAFSPECHGHLLSSLELPLIPPPQDPEPTFLAMTRNADLVRGAWGTDDPATGAVAADLYWALATPRLYQTGAPGLVDPFRRLPPDAAPHLRNVLAMALVGEPDPLPTIQAVLSRTRTPPLVPYPLVLAASGGRTWLTDLPGEETIPAAFFLDAACRRPRDPDPSVDLRLALATAAARRDPPRVDLLGADLASDHALVRWNAAMILASIQPDASGLADLVRDPDPRIAKRAELAVIKARGGPGSRGPGGGPSVREPADAPPVPPGNR